MEGSWKTIATPNQRTFGSVAVGEHIYCLGGNDTNTGEFLKKVYKYNVLTEEWEDCAPMPVCSMLPAYATNGKEIFCVGGLHYADDGLQIGPLMSVYAYSIEDDTWSSLTELPRNRQNHAAVIVDDKLYVIGGTTGTTSTRIDTMDIYDLHSQTWSIKKAPAFYAYSCVPIDGKIYCTGNTTQTQVYDIANNEWSSFVDPIQRSNSALAVLDGKLYYLGGYNSSTSRYYSSVRIYDMTSEQWTYGVSLPVERSGGSAGVATGKLFCADPGFTPDKLYVFTPEGYIPPDPGETANITHKYQTQSGTALRADSTHSAALGERYTASAPVISGYTCIGYRIDGAAQQSGQTAVIETVQSDHEIVFVYVSTGGPDPDACRCCTQVEIKIKTCSQNETLISDINSALIRDGKTRNCGCCGEHHTCC